jgi:hypothetical protein
MMRKSSIAQVILHPAGTNPYDRDTEHPYRIGDARVKALQQFRDTGTLPAGVVAWSDLDRKPLTRDEIDWADLR